MASMTPTISNYSYRYLDNKSKIYYVTRKPITSTSHHFYTSELYTAPMQNRNERDKIPSNVLIGYINADTCSDLLLDVQHRSSKGSSSEYLHEMRCSCLQEMKYLSTILRIPLVVVINMFCDIESKTEEYELFYHYQKYTTALSAFYEPEIR